MERAGTGYYREDVALEIQRLFFETGFGADLYSNTAAIGRVEGTLGGPVADVMVILARCDQATQAFSPPRPGQCETLGTVADTGRTDHTGALVFPNLEEGIYQLSADTLGTSFSEVSPPFLLYLLVGDADTETGYFVLSN